MVIFLIGFWYILYGTQGILIVWFLGVSNGISWERVYVARNKIQGSHMQNMCSSSINDLPSPVVSFCYLFVWQSYSVVLRIGLN